MGRATARPPVEKPVAIKAPLFQLVLEQFDDDQRHVVLDLGAVSTSMLSLLGRFRCRVEIADLESDGGIERLNIEASKEDLVALAESLLPMHLGDETIEVVFCWDLLNYLRPEATSALMSAIAARAGPDARAHALIVYSERSMPNRPGRFVPDDELKLVNRTVATAEIPAPRYSPEDLGRIMGGFAIEHARLLANGMQEFLFRLRT